MRFTVSITADAWEAKLDIALGELQKCQNEKNIDSCSKCELFLECELRTKYVQAVYDSMSKGESGGFEF